MIKVSDMLKWFKKNDIEIPSEKQPDLVQLIESQNQEVINKNFDTDIDNINHNKDIVKQLTEQNSLLQETIKQMNTTFEEKFTSFTKAMQEEKESREKALLETRQALEDKAKADKEKHTNDFIDKLISEQKIAPQNEKYIAELKKIADLDMESAKVIAENLPTISNDSNKTEQTYKDSKPKLNLSNKQDIESYLSDIEIK